MRDIILHERERGTTIVFCTHIIPDIEALCDHVAVLVSGKLVQEGSVRELLTTKAPGVEIGVEGIAREVLDGMNILPEAVHEIGGRFLVHVNGDESSALLGRLLSAGGRITQVQQVRFSLEDLFMDVVNNAGYVAGPGGEIVG